LAVSVLEIILGVLEVWCSFPEEATTNSKPYLTDVGKEQLNNLNTMLINNHACIAVIDDQFCQVFLLNTDIKELLDGFPDCP
jgi:hypothetical protein